MILDKMIVCRVVVLKAPTNERVRALGPNEKPSVGAGMKRAEILVIENYKQKVF